MLTEREMKGEGTHTQGEEAAMVEITTGDGRAHKKYLRLEGLAGTNAGVLALADGGDRGRGLLEWCLADQYISMRQG